MKDEFPGRNEEEQFCEHQGNAPRNGRDHNGGVECLHQVCAEPVMEGWVETTLADVVYALDRRELQKLLSQLKKKC